MMTSYQKEDYFDNNARHRPFLLLETEELSLNEIHDPKHIRQESEKDFSFISKNRVPSPLNAEF